MKLVLTFFLQASIGHKFCHLAALIIVPEDYLVPRDCP